MIKNLGMIISLMLVANFVFADSLWNNVQTIQASPSLYSDDRASRIGDIITVLIVEKAVVSQKASSSSTRDSTIKGEVKDMFKLNFKGLKISNTPAVVLPKWEIDASNKFGGTGSYKGDYSIAGSVTTRVIDVLSNGNLAIEGRSRVKNNEEENVIAISGIVRPQDIGPNNTILSTQVAEKKIQIVGRGPINDKTKRGFLGRLLDWFWPF